MKILITGGAGFIGSHLCDTFVLDGKEVTVLDNLSTGSLKNIGHLENKINIVNGDIRDMNLVESLMSKTEVVLHMAATVGVNNILENPIESISNNFFGSEIVLNAAQRFNKRTIIASTSEIYGKNLNQPLNENDDRVIGSPQKLRWTYSDAKALEEAHAYFLYLTKNFNVTTIRFFNTVGPRQTGKYGMVIPRFVRSAILNLPLNVYGDGSQTRVFCHVSDTVRGIRQLLNTTAAAGEVFNLGGIEEISILNLAKKVVELTNSNSEIIFEPYEKAYASGFEDMERRVPDISKIKKMTNWVPKLTLRDIIQDVYEYEFRELFSIQN